MSTSTEILGLRIDTMTMAAAASMICEQAKTADRPKYVVKPYVEFLDRAAADPDIITLLNNAWLSLPDSIAVQWGAWYLEHGRTGFLGLITSLSRIILRPRSLTHPIPERFAGVNFAWKMLEEADRQKVSIYLIGHPKGSDIEQTAALIRKRLPDIQIAGTFDGFAANNLEHDLIADLRHTKPDLILVGTGFPRQERLMARLADQLDHGVLIGEGGTFDYASFGGRTRRAPIWMRRLGLEWLWRLILEPQRLGRQLAIPRFIWKLYQAKKQS